MYTGEEDNKSLVSQKEDAGSIGIASLTSQEENVNDSFEDSSLRSRTPLKSDEVPLDGQSASIGIELSLPKLPKLPSLIPKNIEGVSDDVDLGSKNDGSEGSNYSKNEDGKSGGRSNTSKNKGGKYDRKSLASSQKLDYFDKEQVLLHKMAIQLDAITPVNPKENFPTGTTFEVTFQKQPLAIKVGECKTATFPMSFADWKKGGDYRIVLTASKDGKVLAKGTADPSKEVKEIMMKAGDGSHFPIKDSRQQQILLFNGDPVIAEATVTIEMSCLGDIDAIGDLDQTESPVSLNARASRGDEESDVESPLNENLPLLHKFSVHLNTIVPVNPKRNFPTGTFFEAIFNQLPPLPLKVGQCKSMTYPLSFASWMNGEDSKMTLRAIYGDSLVAKGSVDLSEEVKEIMKKISEGADFPVRDCRQQQVLLFTGDPVIAEATVTIELTCLGDIAITDVAEEECPIPWNVEPEQIPDDHDEYSAEINGHKLTVKVLKKKKEKKSGLKNALQSAFRKVGRHFQ